ncbi:hypothetical protein MLD52_11675 [Puniceicoccaceae bacterium K14]|nr:hypothetical protein [Puniceicoccaceae bacterium K14]
MNHSLSPFSPLKFRKFALTLIVFALPFECTLFAKQPIEPALSIAKADPGRFPDVKIVNIFEPEGESNVRSSFRVSENVALIGTEETGDMFKSEDGGKNWRKIIDGADSWGIMDIRNFIRAQNESIYLTTSEPGIVCRSEDDGETWQIVAAAAATRTVGLVELDNGTILTGLRRASKKQTSLIRSEDYFDTVKWVSVSDEEPPQNVTCFHNLGGSEVLAGVGFQGTGKIYKSVDYGLTWEKKADYPEARDMMWFFQDGGKVFIAASGIATLFSSSDNGETWSQYRQFWEKGFLGMSATLEKNGKTYRLLTATDQRKKPYRHVVLISDDHGKSWFEWIELIQDQSGGASNIAVLSDNRVIVGTGNHSAQGRAFTLQVD